jgi:NitT/TauT family transport system substrate-binding protein
MRVKLVILILLSSVFLFLQGCANDTEGNEEVLKIGLLPDDASIPIMIADELGYYENEGLQANIQLFRSAGDRDAAIQAKELNCVSTDVLSLGLFRESGILTYGVAQTEGTYGILINSNTDIHDISDLNGKSIGISFNTLMEYLLDTALVYNEINPDQTNKVSIPSIPARLEMLNNGQIDGATLPEPLVSGAVANGSRLLISNDEFDTFPGILMVTEEYIHNNASNLQAFFRAYNQAVDYINNTPQDDYFSIIKEKLAFPEGSEDYFQVKAYHKIVLPEKQEIEKGMQWLFDKGMISEDYTFEELVLDMMVN